MIRRLFYLVWICTFGLIFVPIKWVLLGTKAGRERRRLIRLTKKQNRLIERQTR